MEINECTYVPDPLQSLPPEAPKPEHKDKREHLKIRISMFFDGTGNNRTNTETREKRRPKYFEIVKSDTWQESSYFNDLSNVARLASRRQQALADLRALHRVLFLPAWTMARTDGPVRRSDPRAIGQQDPNEHDLKVGADGDGELATGSAPADSDGDGMPDAWKSARGLAVAAVVWLRRVLP